MSTSMVKQGIALAASHPLHIDGAPQAWHVGLPVGNGETGAMVWGSGDTIILTLDSYKVWETRTWQPGPENDFGRLRALIRDGQFGEVQRRYAIPPDAPYATRLPIGRFELQLAHPLADLSYTLDLATATVRIQGIAADGRRALIRVYAHAERPIIGVDVQGLAFDHWLCRLVAPSLSEEERRKLESWGYPDPRLSERGEISLLTRRYGESGEYGIGCLSRQRAEGQSVYLAIDTVDLRQEAIEEKLVSILSEHAAADPIAGYAEHTAWWERFWAVSSVELPDPKFEAVFYRELYKLASCSRQGRYPASLQGLWTEDGGLPPWSGDYHFDMNVQETYWPIYTANHLELGEPLYAMFNRLLPKFKRDCESYLGVSGAFSTVSMTLDGTTVYGYVSTMNWLGNGPWVCHHYWLHYVYSGDVQFLREQAYPVMRAYMEMYMNMLEPGEDGVLHLTCTNSPEYGENQPEAWGSDDNGNLALVTFLGHSLLRAAELLQIDDPHRERWEETLRKLVPYPPCRRGEDGELVYEPDMKPVLCRDLYADKGLHVMAGRPYAYPHRHLSHLMAIYPLALLRKGMSDPIDRLIDDSVTQMLYQGTGEWCGWTYPWAALIAAHAGWPELSREMLRRYLDSHTYPNTLHENGDYKRTGTTILRYPKPCVTLEAGFAACAALLSWLLQSQGGDIRLFPGIPDDWPGARFDRLRAEGGFVVSAALDGGKLTAVEIESECGGACRLLLSGLWPAGCFRIEEVRSGAVVDYMVSDRTAVFETERGGRYVWSWERHLQKQPDGK